MKLFKLYFIFMMCVSCGSDETIDKEIIEDPIEVIDVGDNAPNPDFPLSDQTNTGNWTLNKEVSDEFDVNTLDEKKWQIQGEGGVYKSNFIGRAPSQFSINNAIIQNKKLKILTKWEPNFDFSSKTQTVNGVVYKYENITTAAVISKKQFQYGYMEIKCKSAKTQVTSSFWTTGTRSSELDMFEMFGGHKTSDSWRKRLKFNIISWDPDNYYYQPNGKGPVYTSNIQVTQNTADDFHVYGFDWTADSIKIYVDGVLQSNETILKSVVTNNGANPEKWVTDVPYWIWFDSETFPWLGIPNQSDLEAPAEYQIEYIRVWQKS
jgi:beta-glucanase (GH16 family)